MFHANLWPVKIGPHRVPSNTSLTPGPSSTSKTLILGNF